jgi:plasmid stabilization system protein ParE
LEGGGAGPPGQAEQQLALGDAIDVIRDTVERSLSRAPFVYRKAGDSPFLHELRIPFGGAGYVALYELKDATRVAALAVRHQLEDDYH